MLAVILAGALLWTLSRPLPSSVRLYFKAQLLYLPPIYLTYWLVGRGPFYAVVYTFFTGLIFLTALWVVWEALMLRDYRLRGCAVAVLITLMFGRMAYSGLDRLTTWYDWIVLTQAVILLWCGTMLSSLAAHQQDQRLHLALGFLWLTQSLFAFGYFLGTGWPIWEKFNYTIPPLLVTVCCLYIGLRRHREPNSQSAMADSN